MEVRWIASHYRGSIIVFDNFKHLYEHFKYISEAKNSEFVDKATKIKAKSYSQQITFRQVILIFSIIVLFFILNNVPVPSQTTQQYPFRSRRNAGF